MHAKVQSPRVTPHQLMNLIILLSTVIEVIVWLWSGDKWLPAVVG